MKVVILSKKYCFHFEIYPGKIIILRVFKLINTRIVNKFKLKTKVTIFSVEVKHSINIIFGHKTLIYKIYYIRAIPGLTMGRRAHLNVMWLVGVKISFYNVQ